MLFNMSIKLRSTLKFIPKRFSLLLYIYILIIFVTSIIVFVLSFITDRSNNSSELLRAKQFIYKPNHSNAKITYDLTLTNERVWFLTNGSLKPDPTLAQYLALWPEEGEPEDDRIVNQLMYVPLNYSPANASIKTIFLYHNDNDRDWRLNFGQHIFNECPVNSCSLVGQDRAQDADLIFFKSDFKKFKFKRSPKQIWLLFVIESPYYSSGYQHVRDNINWTATYRHDSDIPVPYAKFFPYSKAENLKQNNDNFNYAKGKTKKVVWFVSNCWSINNRLKFAKELQKHIQVDIYGYCSKKQCSKRKADKCLKMMENDYKFYLSFENSNCKDYITEKYWYTALNHNIVPIVMGANSSTYERFSPPNSFIHVDDFASIKHLAQYLNELDNNDTEYNKYFRWKGSGEIRDISMWCRICALIHSPVPHKVYGNFTDWWKRYNDADVCHIPQWV